MMQATANKQYHDCGYDPYTGRQGYYTHHCKVCDAGDEDPTYFKFGLCPKCRANAFKNKDFISCFLDKFEDEFLTDYAETYGIEYSI